MRKLAYAFLLASLAAGGSVMLAAQGQGQDQGQDHRPSWIPDSSFERSEDHGLRAHTNHLIRADVSPAASSGPTGQTPTTIRAAYSLAASGGSGTIAIVDAYDYSTALSDFNAFSKQFGLPQQSGNNATSPANTVFQVVYANGRRPSANCGWAQEAALDIEWAHAMAPNAKIVLVEAASSSFTDLFFAADVAASQPNVREISMSWGGGEFSGESTYDSHFLASGIVYFAASGDTGGATIYPGVSPYVVAAGGTSLKMNGTTFVSETGWSGTGGGPSRYELRPVYQNGISAIVGNARGVPDYSFDGDPNTGVSVYDTTRCQGMSGWMVFGGTSVSSPSLSGIVNLAASLGTGFAASSGAELTRIYGGLGGPNFRDITSGTAGRYTARTGWDFVTGVGSNLGLRGK